MLFKVNKNLVNKSIDRFLRDCDIGCNRTIIFWCNCWGLSNNISKNWNDNGIDEWFLR